MTKKYKNLILDNSVLDVDKWFPESAVNEIADAIIEYEKRNNPK